jgi:hypothetical protein
LRIARRDQNQGVAQQVAAGSRLNQPLCLQIVHGLFRGGKKRIHRRARLDLLH